MQFVGIPRLRTGLPPYPVNRCGIELAEITSGRRLTSTSRLYRVRTPLLEGGIVEEGVGLRVENLVGKERGLRRIARD